MLSLLLAEESAHEVHGLLDVILPEHYNQTIADNFGYLGNTILNGTPASFSHVITTLIGCVIVIALGLASCKKFKSSPDAKLNPRTIFEIAIDAILGLLEGQIHDKKKARKYLPLIFAIAVFIFCNNIFALIPGFGPATDNLNTNIGMALIVFVTSWVAGIKEKGVKHWFGEMCGPVKPLAFLMLPIELIGHIVRPITLTIRLMGNMYGDHAIVAILLMLCAPAIPAVMMTLGVLVVFIQTVVFTMLSTVYISMAISEE